MLRARGETVRTRRFRLHATRGATGFLALALFFKAMKELPLATAVTLNYISPIYMAVFSILAAPRAGTDTHRADLPEAQSLRLSA